MSKNKRIFKPLFCGHSYVGGHLGFSFRIFNFIVNLFKTTIRGIESQPVPGPFPKKGPGNEVVSP
jgi:hypothetical protein